MRFKEKYNIKRLSIYSITLTGIFIGLLTATKLLDKFIPQINDYAIWQTYWTLGALAVIALPFAPAFLTLFIAPLVWFTIGQTEIVSPWSFALDYLVPLLGLIVIKFCPNKWWTPVGVAFAFGIKVFSYTWSGVLFWETPWWGSFTYNVMPSLITASITLPLVFISYDQLKKLRNRIVLNQSNKY